MEATKETYSSGRARIYDDVPEAQISEMLADSAAFRSGTSAAEGAVLRSVEEDLREELELRRVVA